MHALIVEDDETLADLLAEILQRRGFDTTVLHQGGHAAEWIRQHQPDLVLLDLMLPDRDGFSICREVKLDRQTNLTPIVMVTAMARHEDQVSGLAVGANEYITKPFTIDGLYAAADRALAWREHLRHTGSHVEVQCTLQSDLQLLGDVNSLLASLLLHTPLPADTLHLLTYAVSEMCANAIEWGNRNRRELFVTLTYRIEPGRVVIIIKDQGAGFDRAALPHAADADDPIKHLDVRQSLGLRVGGYGILTTRGMMDEMTYNEAGNEVRLVKHFA